VKGVDIMSKIPLIVLIALLYLPVGSCGQDVHWQNLPQIKSMAFTEPDEAWLVTAKGNLLLTKDRGKNWQTINGDAIGGFQAATMLDSGKGLAVSNRGDIWSTSDGGQTWTKKSTLKSDDWHFNESKQIHFVDELHGWIIETLTVWRSEDGGANWEKAFSPLEQKAAGQPVRAAFAGADHVWICGTDGEVYNTVDGGKTWLTRKISTKNSDFRDIFFINEKTGWLIGYASGQFNNLFFRTDDAGKTWNPIQTNIDRTYLASLYFLDEREGWASGEAWSNGNESDTGKAVLIHTTDGGKTWESTFMTGDEPFFDRIRFLDQREGWLFARDRVYRTDDSGRSWQAVLKLSPAKSE
jgi:photosystem II stability/assembly factor-like uncharacterized protein